jgi:ABC-type Mn2+/Zn2+ transport system ATPase subunit
MSLLQVDAINTYYGDAHAPFDVSLRVEENEVVALLGRNGAGKSTTLKTIMGVLAPESGAIRFAGQSPPIRLRRLAFSLCRKSDASSAASLSTRINPRRIDSAECLEQRSGLRDVSASRRAA